MSRWLTPRVPRADPWWDLEGPTARQERRQHRIRRTQVLLAWLDLAAMAALATIGPHAFRLAFLH